MRLRGRVPLCRDITRYPHTFAARGKVTGTARLIRQPPEALNIWSNWCEYGVDKSVHVITEMFDKK